MNTYTIVLSDNTKLSGFKNLNYAGHDAYGKETYEGSDAFTVKDIYFANDLKEVILENQ
jgi:hypothetical protein